MSLLHKYNSKRLLHINGNIILAGTITSLVVAGIIHLSDVWMISNVGLIVAFTAVLDIILDPAIFFLLHYKSSRHSIADFKQDYFIKDAIKIQSHRILLSFSYYGIATSLQAFFLMHGLGNVKSIISAYILALIATRIVHTIYGIKTGLFE